jgi:alanyl-tRNA synthetase
VEKILSHQRSLEKEVEQLKARMASLSTEGAEEEARTVNGVMLLVRQVAADNPASLRALADKFRDKIKSGIVALGSVAGSKVFLIVVVTKDLTNRFHAGEIIKQIATVVGGSGGGRADMAQAGGTEPEMLEQALEKVFDVVAGGP